VEEDRPTGVTNAMVLELANGALNLLIALAVLLILTLARQDLTPGVRRLTTVLIVVFGLLGITNLILGLGLRRLNGWAWRGSLVTAVVGLLLPIPILSTVINALQLKYLVQADVKAAFLEEGLETKQIEAPMGVTGPTLERLTPPEEPGVPAETSHEISTPPETPLWAEQATPHVSELAKTELLYKEPAHLAWLVIASGQRAGSMFRLQEVTTIGRIRDRNDIAIDDDAISLQHAKIRLEDGQFFLYDLATSNGTFVNGQRIDRHPLRDQDVIQMGTTTLVFLQVK